jgi:hypothetical protein
VQVHQGTGGNERRLVFSANEMLWGSTCKPKLRYRATQSPFQRIADQRHSSDQEDAPHRREKLMTARIPASQAPDCGPGDRGCQTKRADHRRTHRNINRVYCEHECMKSAHRDSRKNLCAINGPYEPAGCRHFVTLSGLSRGGMPPKGNRQATPRKPRPVGRIARP